MKKVNVSKDRCIGCGACVAIDPEHFEFDDEGKSSVISNENLESDNLVNAIESCPTSAIELKEETEMENQECHCEDCDCETCDCSEEHTCDNPNCTCDPCTCDDCHCNDTENE